MTLDLQGSAPRRRAFHLPFPRHDRTAHIRIDLARCAACGRCAEACPREVLGMISVLRHRHVHVDRADECRGCQACVAACAQKAIHPRAVDGASGAASAAGAAGRRERSVLEAGQRPTSFNHRAFTTLMIALTGLGLPATGIANHLLGIAPLTSARHAWMSAHNALGLLFSVFCVVHVVLNRRALWSHLRGNPARGLSGISREAALAVVSVGLALLLLVGHAFHAGR
ncbi:MAG: 4Fe-4S binding protein [Deltaproteobacteria bacterium]|nr:4Fe-4S binding protein [Deltaproteobacteria bacterium]